MPPLPEHAYGRWLFSHDEDGARVYRPRDAAFAPSRRPRDGFDIEADGGFAAYRGGAADAPVSRRGQWTMAGNAIRVTYEDGAAEDLAVVEAAPGLLKVRRT